MTGYPVRSSLREALALTPQQARAQFGLDENRPTLFVFGGSRGAQSINNALMSILPAVLEQIQVIHIAGTQTWHDVEQFLPTLSLELAERYKPFPYLHEQMGMAFRAADLIVARAGASMLGESPAFGVPAVLVPYPHAWRYQKVNADYLVKRGAGYRLDDDKLLTELQPLVMDLLLDSKKLEGMKMAAAVLDQPDAAVKIVEVLRTVRSL